MASRRSPMGVLFLTLFIDLVGFSIIFPLFPDMLVYYLESGPPGGLLDQLRGALESLAGGSGAEHASFTAVLFGGFLGSLYSILQFLCAPVWGSLSDRYGRRPILLLTIAGMALSYLLWIFSRSFTLLLLSRILGGCMSGNISTATAAVADVTSREHRARGMGLIGAAFGLGFICGPAIGGLTYALLGGAASRIDILAAFPDLAAAGIHPFSTPALVAFLLSLANLAWIGARFDETLTSERREEARRHPRPLHPILRLGRVDIPGVTTANFAYFIFLLAFSGAEFTLTFFAYEAFGYHTPQITGLFVFAGLIIATIQGGVVRRVAPRFGERTVSLAGLAIIVPGFLTICFSPPSGLLLYAGLGLMAVGSALVIPCLTALVSLYTPASRQGVTLGAFRSVGALARAVGPIVFCFVYWRFGRQWPYVAGAALLALPLLLTALLPRPRKAEQPVADRGAATGAPPA